MGLFWQKWPAGKPNGNSISVPNMTIVANLSSVGITKKHLGL